MSHFDALVEGEMELPEHPPEALTDVEKSIGKLIADNLVEDGATLQMGMEIFLSKLLSTWKYLTFFYTIRNWFDPGRCFSSIG